MGNWTISYVQKPLGPAVHGVVVVRDDAGRIFRWFEGLATDKNGFARSIGVLPSDTIKVYSGSGLPLNYDTTFPEQIAFEGPKAQVLAKFEAGEALKLLINRANIPYPFLGFIGDNSNSNAVISTVFRAMGVEEPFPDLWAPGRWRILVSEEELALISLKREVREFILGPARCFLAGTPILMADGSTKPIEAIRPGDEVAAFDPDAQQGLGLLRPGKVTRTFTNVTRTIINLRGLHMTPGHVVLMDNGEWDIIARALKDDRAIVEEREGPDGASKATLVRARTGACSSATTRRSGRRAGASTPSRPLQARKPCWPISLAIPIA
jgi:hypothetical protein